MITKPNDVMYCGVRREKINSSKPILDKRKFRLLVSFIKERYKIHLRKDVSKIKPPFTKNVILKEFRFTNVRREHDRETLWLINNITSNKELCYEDKLLNCILFRLFNKHETSELINMPIPFLEEQIDSYNEEFYREIFEYKSAEDPKYVFFTGAFNTGAVKRYLKRYLPEGQEENNMCMRVMKFITYLVEDKIHEKIKLCTSQEEVYELLRGYMGIGEFLAYQMFVDMTYIEEFPFSENEFTVAGPGCKKGLDELFKDRDGLSYEECLFWLRDNWKKLNISLLEKEHRLNPKNLMVDLPEEDRVMNVMSLENCFCEFSKYVKTLEKRGRPRKKYVYKGEV